MTTAVEILRAALDDSCESLGRVLAGIGDAEFFWEPVPGCWTVHRRSEPPRAAGADGCGEWVIDYDPAQPTPAPFTTIAWRTVHIASVNYLYWDYAFGTASASFDLEMPADAVAAVEWLRASQEPLTAALSGLTPADLDMPAKTNWGDLWPTHRIFATLIKEQVHHGAEISLLRDLYRRTGRVTGHG